MNKTVLILAALSVGACNNSNKETEADINSPAAVGPDGPESIVIEPLTVSTDPAVITRGQQAFAAKGCVACHKADDTKLVGPGLKGVTTRHSIKWIQRMILHPEIMVQQDPVAKGLLAKLFVPMANQNVDPKTELPALISYLKSIEK